MAFLDLNIGAPAMQARAQGPKLGAQERKVVLLARTDPVSSLGRTCLGRLKSILFGIAPPRMLADARLEELRRYAVLYRVHGDALAEAEIERVRAAGYSEDELAKTRALIDAARGARPQPRGRAHLLAVLFGLAMAGLLAFGAASELSRTIDSPLMAGLLIGLAVVSLAPVAGRGGSIGRKAYR